MTDNEMWGLLVGAALPPVIALINKKNFTGEQKGLVTFFVCVIASIGTIYFTGEAEQKSMITIVLMVMVSSLTTYKNVWKPMGVTNYLEKKIMP